MRSATIPYRLYVPDPRTPKPLNTLILKNPDPKTPKPLNILTLNYPKLGEVPEKSKTLKKMSETLSLASTPNKSAKPLCSVNKIIHSITVNFILRYDFIVIVPAHLISSLRSKYMN